MSRRLSWVALALALFGSCSGGNKGATEIALNWKPEPEFGGLFAAQAESMFEAAGAENVEITGGPGAPVVQLIIAGRVAFGVVTADEIVVARARGEDLVAIFATYQRSPLAIMSHADRGAESFEELFALGGLLAVEPGVPYVEFLKRKFDLSKTKLVPSSFSVAPFVTNPEMSMQCFVTSEPIEARRQGADPRVFLVADTGYEPYEAVFAARGELVRDQPELVRSVVTALRAGWRHYLDDPLATNEAMHALNPDMDLETFNLASIAQHELIEDAETQAHGLGYMSAARWQELADQLLELGIIERAVDGAACFVDVD